jgi:hypothetical protein
MLAIVISAVSLAALGAAAPASAGLRHELQQFSDCPVNAPEVLKCIYAQTVSGEFVLGKSTVPIVNTVTIQGGTKSGGILVPAVDGNTLSKTPEPVPGGLIGIELPGNFTTVNSIAELAGQATVTTEVLLPLKVRLENLLLGNACYIGSEAEPLALHLIFTKTNPPPPNKPIEGFKEISNKGKGTIIVIKGKLVDNSFAAPGANGCTLLPLVGDLAVDNKVGLPSPAGTNTAIMEGPTEVTSSAVVKNVLPAPDFGRCVKLEGKPEGEFADKACKEITTVHNGKYEWKPGPGPKAKFTGVGHKMVLATAGGQTVTCTASSSAGEYTGPKTESLTLKLTGCSQSGKPKVACHSSSAAEGEIVSAPLVGSLDFINEESTPPVVGLVLKPASGSTLAAFQCGSSSNTVTGAVIAPVSPVDKTVSTLKLLASASGGKQVPEAFEEGAKEVLTLNNSKGAEQVGLAGGQADTNEEPIKIKTGF